MNNNKNLRNKITNSIYNNKILIAPLNWGLGHATRCIPIIKALIKEDFEPILAGDGDSLLFLQKEFPNLKSYKLPSYNIRYTRKGHNLKYRLLFDSSKILKAVKKEKNEVERIIQRENIQGIISDNRFGVRSNKIPSVYITHQVNVLSGSTTPITSKVHQNIFSKFDECWVPDYSGKDNLAGELSHTNKSDLRLKYINPISRFDRKVSTYAEMKNSTKIFDVMILLSGPEPQRGLLEEKLLNKLESYPEKVLFIRGIFSGEEISIDNKNIKIVNFMMQKDLQKAILESKIIIARSGYSTIMDLERLNAKAFFIPTPGQHEQEYLAQYMEKQNIAPFALQNDFELSLLETGKNYSGFISKRSSKRDKNHFMFDIFK